MKKDISEEKLIYKAAEKNHIDCTTLHKCETASNYIYYNNDIVIKMYHPSSYNDSNEEEYLAELSGLEYAALCGIPVPEITDTGRIHCDVNYPYLVMKRIKGKAFQDVCDTLSVKEKKQFSRALAELTELLHSNTENIRNKERFYRTDDQSRWCGMLEQFQIERKQYLEDQSFVHVFVHGDLNPENIIMLPDGRLSLIDFGDARLSSESYDLAPIVSYLFEFEQDYIGSFFYGQSKDEVSERILQGLLLHEYGANMIQCNLSENSVIHSVEQLRRIIIDKISRKG